MKRLIFILSLIPALPIFSQTDKIDSLLNDLVYSDKDPLEIPGKPVKFDFLYAGLNYSSNTFFAGREISSKMFNISGNLFYYHASGLFFGASGGWYDQMTPAYSHTLLSAGYSKSIDKKRRFTFRTSYSRFIYYKVDSANDYPYKNNVNLGFSFRKKWIGAKIGSNLLFGEENKINLSAALYARLNLIKFSAYNKFYTAPEISSFFSTESVSTTEIPDQYPDQIPAYEDKFGILNTQVSIPLGLSVGDFDLEFCYTVNIPTTRDVNISYPVKSFYSFSLGYMLPLAR